MRDYSVANIRLSKRKQKTNSRNVRLAERAFLSVYRAVYEKSEGGSDGKVWLQFRNNCG